jgi:hypothetical protein
MKIKILIREKYKSLPIEKIEKNSTFFFYGRTNSGKTFTMNEILNLLSLSNSSNEYTISISEIYVNKFNHLKTYKNINLGGVLSLVSSNRKIQETKENIESSRSILILHFEKINITFVDLMGSERSEDMVGNENNKNLMSLQRCITAILEKSSHIPFRECELTKLFEKEIKTNQVVFIGCVDGEDLKETNRTLSFLNQVARCEVAKPVKKKIKKKIIDSDCEEEEEDTEDEKEEKKNNYFNESLYAFLDEMSVVLKNIIEK